MLHPRIFKQIQKLCKHTFILDACANHSGDNALCAQYCSPEDSFLSRDLQGEFVWLNPPFKCANEFLEAYFAQKHEYPDQVGASILLPCWRQFADIPELRRMSLLKHYAPGTHLFIQPGQDSAKRHEMAGVPWGVNMYYDPPTRTTFYVQAHQGRQALVFQAKVGEQSGQLLLDTGTTDKSFINAATCRRLGIPIRTPSSTQAQEQGPKNTSTSVDPTEFSALLLEDPTPRTDSGVPVHLLTPVTYGNGIQASPIGIATFTLHCQGFRTKVTCPVLDLADELDVVLGHEWCYEHKVIISYKDEHVTFVHTDRPHLLKFDDSRAPSCVQTSSLYSIRQAARFV